MDSSHYHRGSRQLQGKGRKQEGAACLRWGVGLVACGPQLLLKGTETKGPRGGTSPDDYPHCLHYCSISCRSRGGRKGLAHSSHRRLGQVDEKQGWGSREFPSKLTRIGCVGEVPQVLEKEEPEKPKEVT